jgi:gamma-glutamyl hercynylcysteine S-oxide synthase
MCGHHDIETAPPLLAAHQRLRRLVNDGQLMANMFGKRGPHQIVQADQYVRKLKRAEHCFRIAGKITINVGSPEADHYRLPRVSLAKSQNRGRTAPGMQCNQQIGSFALIGEGEANLMPQATQDRGPARSRGTVAGAGTFSGRGHYGNIQSGPYPQSVSIAAVRMTHPVTTSRLIEMLQDSRARTLELVADLDDEQLIGPQLDIVNPPLWEIGHVAWFYEFFVLRNLDGRSRSLHNADALYDSSAVPHDTRWHLPLPSRTDTLAYLDAVEHALLERLQGPMASEEESALYLLGLFHEDMHGEALTYTRQTLGYREPRIAGASRPADVDAGPWPGDVPIPGGRFWLGASAETPFSFDNEKWAHPVEVEPFRIARAPVTNAEFLGFVEDGGYRARRFWDDKGWGWRETTGARHPLYWVPDGNGRFAVRHFEGLEALCLHRPVVHVNWYEAAAWCRWAGRRLPTEAEWEVAAAGEPGRNGGLGSGKRRYPWGETPPSPAQANLDGLAPGVVDVAACPAGDSAWGCRQMLGNVWEWTASRFMPYPGFTPDAYADYSVPWFGTRMVLRGGCRATRGRMISNSYRNFFTPDRRDVVAGFRTCAV